MDSGKGLLRNNIKIRGKTLLCFGPLSKDLYENNSSDLYTILLYLLYMHLCVTIINVGNIIQSCSFGDLVWHLKFPLKLDFKKIILHLFIRRQNIYGELCVDAQLQTRYIFFVLKYICKFFLGKSTFSHLYLTKYTMNVIVLGACRLLWLVSLLNFKVEITEEDNFTWPIWLSTLMILYI